MIEILGLDQPVVGKGLLGGIRIGNYLNGSTWGGAMDRQGPCHSQSRGGTREVMEGGPFGFKMEKMRHGAVKWLRYRSLRVRKALRCHLAPLPKVRQLISVIECASRSAAMPSSNLERCTPLFQVHEKAMHYTVCATASL